MKEETQALAKLRLEELLTFFGINAHATVTEQDDAIELNVDTEQSGRLIGRHGENLQALQYLLNMILRQQADEQVYARVDIGGYKKAQAEVLTEKARGWAQKVMESGEEMKLEPMRAAERRVVHMVLADFPELTGDSEGEEPHRHIVIRKRAA